MPCSRMESASSRSVSGGEILARLERGRLDAVQRHPLHPFTGFGNGDQGRTVRGGGRGGWSQNRSARQQGAQTAPQCRFRHAGRVSQRRCFVNVKSGPG